MLKQISAVALVVTGLFMAPVRAADYKLEFSTTNFSAQADNYHVPPQEVVAGSLTFSAATIDSAWTALKAIDLSIAGHRYSLDEVFFVSAEPGFAHGGGNESGSALREYTNDFFFRYVQIPSGPSSGYYFGLWYTVEGRPFVFASEVSRVVSITELAPVPEPETYVMLLAGLGLIGSVAARRRKAWPAPALSSAVR